jgi:hypothetical protein
MSDQESLATEGRAKSVAKRDQAQLIACIRLPLDLQAWVNQRPP